MGEGQRERGTQNLRQALSCQPQSDQAPHTLLSFALFLFVTVNFTFAFLKSAYWNSHLHTQDSLIH